MSLNPSNFWIPPSDSCIHQIAWANLDADWDWTNTLPRPAKQTPIFNYLTSAAPGSRVGAGNQQWTGSNRAEAALTEPEVSWGHQRGTTQSATNTYNCSHSRKDVSKGWKQERRREPPGLPGGGRAFWEDARLYQRQEIQGYQVQQSEEWGGYHWDLWCQAMWAMWTRISTQAVSWVQRKAEDEFSVWMQRALFICWHLQVEGEDR